MISDSSVNICEQKKRSSGDGIREEWNLFCNQETEFGGASVDNEKLCGFMQCLANCRTQGGVILLE